MNKESKIGLVLLAAGGSRRLGQPKQLVSFKGKCLLQHAIDCTDEILFESKVMILGANAEMIKQKVDPKSFHICINDHWERGMAGSLWLGVDRLLHLCTDLNAIVIMVSDQPFISKELLMEMVGLYKSESSIVVCQYQGVKGVPALFAAKYFDELSRLSGDQGARKIIREYEDILTVVKFDQGDFDIDTIEDLKQLNELENRYASND